ncbi:MAG: hypothetical protein ACREQI_01105 [Candidatus Binataceae bacterium]
MDGHDYRSLVTRAVSDTRSEFATIPGASTSVEALSKWFSWLRASRPEYLENSSQFSASIRENTEANPVNWCNARELILAPKFVAELSGIGTSLPSFAAYMLGRAAIAATLADPVGTTGLTLPYRLVGQLDQLGIAFAGCNDALSESNIRENAITLGEIDGEIARMANDPMGTVRSIDHGAALGTARMWHEAVSVEQALDWRINEVPVDIFAFANVLISIARSAPDLAGFRLEALGHPALISAVLVHHATDEPTILKLLEHAPVVFDANGRWLHGSAVRLVLDAFESHCLESVGAILRNLADDEEGAEQCATAELRVKVATVADVLCKRADGPRLAVEWLAHLLGQLVGREVREPARGRKSDRFRSLLLLLNAAIGRFASEIWAEPGEIWRLFGGGPNASFSAEHPKADSPLPMWHDGIGRADALAPFAVGALLNGSDEAEKKRISEILPWLREIFNHLEREPALLWLSSFPSRILLDILARPVGFSDDPAGWLAATWEGASDARLRSRFYRTGEIAFRSFRWDENLVVRQMDRCSAILDLGSSILRWISTREDRKPIAPPVAQLLQDFVDEYRYCFPPIHLDRPSRHIGRLSGAMAVARLLVDADSYACFVFRYAGDDDALVAAISNTAANGVPPEVIAAGLKQAGVEVHSLRDRWIVWQKKLPHEAVALSPVIEQLERICKAAD